MREIFKKAKQNSLRGMKLRRMLKLKGFALSFLLLIGAALAGSAYCSDASITKVGGSIVGVVMATAPLAFVVPKDLNLSDEEAKGLEALAKFLNEQIGEHQKGLLDSEDLSNKVKKAFEDFAKDYGLEKDKLKKLDEALKAQGLAIKVLKEGKVGDAKPFKEQLKGLFSEENINSVLKNNSNHMVGIEVKAASTIMTTNASTNATHALSFEVIPGINEAPREQPVVLTALNKGKTSSRTIIWINRVNGEGGAAFIAEGVLKPLMDWTYAEENSIAKKVAVSAKVSSEMLNDFEYMESEIRMLLTRDLYQKIDDKLLAGTTNDEPKGIIVNAGGYLGSGLDGQINMPNNADAIRAAMLQMRLINYKPDVVFMNPTDAAVMDLTKSSTGNYIKIELEGVLRSLQIIETTQIDAGKFLLMDTAKWIVKILEDLRIEFGWENDDFRKNLVTIICEARLHSYQNSIDKGSVIHESFATVKEALNAEKQTTP